MPHRDGKKTFKGMQAFSQAFGFVFSNIPHLLQTSILTLFLIILYEMYIYSFHLEFYDRFFYYHPHARPNINRITGVVPEPYLVFVSWNLVIYIIFAGIFNIRWHRSTLFGPKGKDTGFGFELSLSLWTYIRRALFISFTHIPIFIILTLPFYIISFNYLRVHIILGGVVGALIALVASSYVTCRLSLALPAAALKIDNFGLRESWKATQGHARGLMGTYILMLITISIAGELVMKIAGAVIYLFSLPYLLNYAPYTIVKILGTGLSVSLASFVYLQLGKPPAWIEKGDTKSE